MSLPGVAIVGSSVAAVKTAEALRSHGYPGPVTIVGEENEIPYDKPPLSKQLLVGSMEESANLLITRDAADRAQITMKLGSAAVALDTDAHLVTLADGEEIPYETLVIATGVRARPSPWGQPSGVHLLRTIADVRALRRSMLLGGRLVIIGAGFIGAEAAAAAVKLGMSVQIVDPVPIPMGRVLGDDVGKIISGLHARHGVETFFGVGVSDVVVDSEVITPGAYPGLKVHLDNGVELSADVVLVGIGTKTNQEWLVGSKLQLDNGVVCDRFSRAEGVQDVYAVGDLARWFHPRHDSLVRVEHWTNAVEHAQTVAYNITHPHEPQQYSPVEYIWSDQYDWKIQITGRTGAAYHVTVTDKAHADRFAVVYADDGEHYSGAMTANWPRALIACRRAVGTGVTIGNLLEVLEALLTRKTPIGAAGPSVA